MIKIEDICVKDYYFCDTSCKYFKGDMCNRTTKLTRIGVESLVKYDTDVWYRTQTCMKEIGFGIKVHHVETFKEDTFTEIDGEIMLKEFLGFFHQGYGNDVMLIVKLKSGKIMVFAEVNLLGGVCDDCTCDEMEEEVVKYSFKKIGVV